MGKINLNQLYKEGIKEITANAAAWKDFLVFTSQLYKYSFVEKVQIYQQKPDATYLADFDTWQSVYRYVSVKQKGIAVSKVQEDGVKRQYLFDIAQTYGKDFEEPDWSLSKDEATKVMTEFYRAVFSESEVPESFILEDIVAKGVSSFMEKDSTGLVEKNKIFIENSVLFALGEKLEWLTNYDAIVEFSELNFTSAEIETIGQVTNEVIKYSLLRINTLQQQVRKEMEEVKNDKRNESNVDRKNNSSRSATISRSESRRTASALRKGGTELSGREQSNAGTNNVGRRNADVLSSSERKLGDRSGDQILQESEETESFTRIDERRNGGKAQQNVTITSTGESDGSDDQESSGQPNESERRSFQQLEGNLSNNKQCHFKWYGGSDPALYLIAAFKSIDPIQTEVCGHTEIFSIVEFPSMRNLISLKEGILETRSIDELYSKLKSITEGKIDIEFEKEFFSVVKAYPKNNMVRGIQGDDIEWYQTYLQYISSNEQVKKSELLKMTVFAANPYLKAGVAIFAEDKAAILKMENSYHCETDSNGAVTLNQQGMYSTNYWSILENKDQKAMFTFEGTSKVFVRDLDEFKQFVERADGEITLGSLTFERDMLIDKTNLVVHRKGVYLNEIEFKVMKEHLEVINPYAPPGKSTEIRFLQDPRVAPFYDDDWNEFGEDEGPVEDDGAFYLDTNKGVQAGQIEVRKVSGGKLMYRKMNTDDQSIGHDDEKQDTIVENKDDQEIRIDHSWSITAEDEYLRKLGDKYYLFGQDGYCLEVKSNSVAAACSFYQDIDPRKVDKFEEYAEWQKLNSDEQMLKYTHDESYQDRYIGVFDKTIKRFLVEAASLKIVEGEIYWRPENHRPDKFKVVDSSLVLTNSGLQANTKRKITQDNCYLYCNGQSSIEIFLKNGMHVLTLSNISAGDVQKILDKDSTAKVFDADLILITEGVEVPEKLEGTWSSAEILEIIKVNVAEIIDRNVENQSLFYLPIVERLTDKMTVDEQSEVIGIEQSLFDFDFAEARNDSFEEKETFRKAEIPSNTSEVGAKNEDRPRNYFPDSFIQYEPGKRQKAKDNLATIKLLKELDLSRRDLTNNDQKILAKYSGWGGIPEIFDEKNSSWEKERNELRELIPDSQFADLRSSVLTAFFTDPEIISSMYKFVQNYGDFSNANILDPAMGTGNFFQALPPQLQKANLKGLEIDEKSAAIAKALYPDAEIINKGYESVEFSEKMDLVIGNFPFNNIKVLDPKYDKFKFVVHDYFMAKSVDLLEQNGLLLFITSAGTMDKKDSQAREYVAKRANLLGAIRLPKTTFKQSAGTEVISDILIFQKKTFKEMTQAVEDPSWLRTVEHPEHEGLMINQYFLENPDHVLGTIHVKNFQGKTIDVHGNDETELVEQIDQVLDDISNTAVIEKTTIKKRKKVEQTIEVSEIEVPEGVDKYSFFMVGNRVFFHTIDGKYEEFKSPTMRERIKYMLPVKQAVQGLLDLQRYIYEDSELEAHLKALNDAYDTFVAKAGYFNDTANMRALREDLKFPLLLSLEKETDDGYAKQPIFYKATVRPKEVLTEVANAKEAVRFSMTRKRKIDFDFIKSIYPNHDIKALVNELKGEIFLNPSKIGTFASSPYQCLDAWEVADEYLSGNVVRKLDEAERVHSLAEDDDLRKQLEDNISALEKAQPEKLLPGDIKYQIGSPWIPAAYYTEFMHELLETPRVLEDDIKVSFSEHNATFRISKKNSDQANIIATQKFGSERISGYEIMEASLNLQQVVIKDRVEDDEGKVKYVINAAATMVAKGKQSDIENEFQKWLFADQSRTNNLMEIYNARFNTNVPRSYNGDDFVFDEMNIDMQLRLHQKDVIARILFDGRALMAHEVGAGKTAAMLTAGMYLKQNGLINKPLYVVPNHLTEAWGKEILTFYPNANILITGKKDFEKRNRQEFISKIATGDYDAIIIGHSQFERIPLSEERQRETIQLQIDEVTDIVLELKENNSENWTIKQMERFKKNLETMLKKLDNNERRDEVITFEELGIDFLFVDEAHIYKNLFIYTKMQNVAGVGSSKSQRASDMLGKVRYIQEKNDGKNVVFATGTPISNSMSELYVMQYFLQPEALIERGLKSFDSWAATFGQVTSSLEITPEGSGYRIRNRFSKFHNLPELMKMFSEVADIQTADMLDLPVPELEGGKVATIVTERSAYQEQKMEEFVERSERIRNGMVDPRVDNMLKVTNEAKLMAIDARLLDNSLERDPESKLCVCADKTFSIWEKTKENRSTQIIFSDSGTPKPNQFNVYDEIKDQLVEKGIPAEEIAFIHDAKTDLQRDTLFEKVRNGDVRIILGSTQKLGTGTNIQNKLIHAHHIDCPWKPSDLTQREGRILRQGNENEVVGISRYVKKGTFDAYLWQIQEQKLTYISQVMNGSNINRSMDDLDDTVLTAAEVKAVATDNPLLAKKMNIDNEVARLQIIRSQWASDRSRMDRNIRETYPNKIAYLESNLKKYEQDLDVLEKNVTHKFEMTIDGIIYDDRSEAIEKILGMTLLKPEMIDGKAQTKIGSYRGLEVVVEHSGLAESHIVLQGQSSYRTTLNPNSSTGNITRLMNLPEHVVGLVDETKKGIIQTETQLAAAKKEVNSPFTKQDELDELLKEQQQINKEIELDTLQNDSGRPELDQIEAEEMELGM